MSVSPEVSPTPSPTPSSAAAPTAARASALPTKINHFLRQAIEADLAAGVYAGRRWAGRPADGPTHAAGEIDPARVRMRFPPEPNGYLHIGHAKAILLNFGLAHDFGGVCHLRYDDTNPEKEEQEFVDAIAEATHWLGCDWTANGLEHRFFASNYFDFMFRAAKALIEAGLAYVDEQSPQDMRANRGDFGRPGVDSPYRTGSPAQHLARFQQMRDGQHPDGSMVLRAKIDMASPNINLRDPALYRIRRAHHHNTGDTWCIYPMYTFAHPLEDAFEHITHSMCTLEFEDQRPFYDWVLAKLAELGLLTHPLPRQLEFGRLNVTHVLTSKRKLKQLVDDAHVSGWDDPRMPTLFGLRARGYTPASIRAFVDATGASKTNAWVDYSVLEQCLRDDLDPLADRAMAVLDPLELIITNFPEHELVECSAPVHPQAPGLGSRSFKFGRKLWIERSDFQAVPEKGYHRLYPPQAGAHAEAAPGSPATPGSQVRLKYGFVVRCTGFEADPTGRVTAVHAEYFAGSKSGTPTSGQFKAKGVITWLAQADAVPACVNLFAHLFMPEQPGTTDVDFLTELNPDSLRSVAAFVEPSLAQASLGLLGKGDGQRLQFERHGYFLATASDSGAPTFNRIVGLKDSFSK